MIETSEPETIGDSILNKKSMLRDLEENKNTINREHDEEKDPTLNRECSEDKNAGADGS